ncbi:hypothetical protein [uncultured Chitinophaga sp.]|uniref:hypothetical protein n=1 Tax=uncultured Chitinophaga sp. TaxID=339340 RepID=UPI00260A6ED3|nr:hypothetical protein [uncultured Chitinophaga sp.]
MRSVALFEQDQENRYIYSMILKERFTVDIVSNKEDFQTITEKTNLIVLGFNHFNQYARDLVFAVSSHGPTSKIPLLLLIGVIDKGVQLPKPTNHRKVLFKPFTTQELITAIEEIEVCNNA